MVLANLLSWCCCSAASAASRRLWHLCAAAQTLHHAPPMFRFFGEDAEAASKALGIFCYPDKVGQPSDPIVGSMLCAATQRAISRRQQSMVWHRWMNRTCQRHQHICCLHWLPPGAIEKLQHTMHLTLSGFPDGFHPGGAPAGACAAAGAGRIQGGRGGGDPGPWATCACLAVRNVGVLEPRNAAMAAAAQRPGKQQVDTMPGVVCRERKMGALAHQTLTHAILSRLHRLASAARWRRRR